MIGDAVVENASLRGILAAKASMMTCKVALTIRVDTAVHSPDGECFCEGLVGSARRYLM